MNMVDVRGAINAGRVNVTNHADEEMEDDAITAAQLYDSVTQGEIIEDYPDDFPFPSALILGFDESSRPIHAVIAYSDVHEMAFVITAYVPDPERWVNFRTRRKIDVHD
ncbi:MAG: DUF4258 domain-containing protein [Armatimonadetes bacterium]|nr:DUF4258 domain-containing protein [Armatimonadota bacterium]